MHGRSPKAGLRPCIQRGGCVPHSRMLCITEMYVQNCLRLHVVNVFEQWVAAISMGAHQA